MVTEATHRGEQIATLVVLAVIGVVLGVIEAFLVPVRLFGGVEGLSVVLGFVGNAAVGTFAGIMMRTARAAAVPVLGWFVAVAAITMYAPGGDVVLPGQLKTDPGVVVVTTLFLICGLLGGAAAIVLTVVAGARSGAAARSAAGPSEAPATPSN